MERKFWKTLHEGARRDISEHYEQLQSNLMWARQFAHGGGCDDPQFVKHQQEMATLHMVKIRHIERYVDSDTPQRVKDIIAEARATYEEIMKLN